MRRLRFAPPPEPVLATRADAAVPGLELLVEALGGTHAELNMTGFYSRLADALCHLAELRRAVVFRYDEATHEVRAAGAHGIDLELFADVHISLALAPEAATALAEDRVVEVRPPTAHRVAPAFADLVAGHALIYVPMAAAQRWPGVIIAEPLEGAAPLDAPRRDLLWTLGKSLALASAARTATFNGERARELQERIELARDIHDGVGQRLFGVAMALSKGPVEEDTRVRCESELLGALEDLRAALQRPLGLMTRTRHTTLAAELARIPAEVPGLSLSIEGDLPPVPDHLEGLLQSVLAEAVRNVRRHAQASALVVRLGRGEGLLTLEVENDGVGERRAPGAPGMGLRLAAVEALQAGGMIEFGERVPGTWRVRLAVPEAVR